MTYAERVSLPQRNNVSELGERSETVSYCSNASALTHHFSATKDGAYWLSQSLDSYASTARSTAKLYPRERNKKISDAFVERRDVGGKLPFETLKLSNFGRDLAHEAKLETRSETLVVTGEKRHQPTQMQNTNLCESHEKNCSQLRISETAKVVERSVVSVDFAMNRLVGNADVTSQRPLSAVCTTRQLNFVNLTASNTGDGSCPIRARLLLEEQTLRDATSRADSEVNQARSTSSVHRGLAILENFLLGVAEKLWSSSLKAFVNARGDKNHRHNCLLDCAASASPQWTNESARISSSQADLGAQNRLPNQSVRLSSTANSETAPAALSRLQPLQTAAETETKTSQENIKSVITNETYANDHTNQNRASLLLNTRVSNVPRSLFFSRRHVNELPDYAERNWEIFVTFSRGIGQSIRVIVSSGIDGIVIAVDANCTAAREAIAKTARRAATALEQVVRKRVRISQPNHEHDCSSWEGR